MEGESYQDYGSFKDTGVIPPWSPEYKDDEKQELQPKTEAHHLRRFIPVIFFSMTFYCGVMGSNIIFPQYILDRLQKEQNFSALLGNSTINACLVNQSDPVYEIYLDIQYDSSNFLAAASFVGGIPNLVSVIIFGALSDKLGRKKIIYIANAGLIFLTVGLSVLINLNLPLPFYFFLTFVNGCCGSSGTMVVAVLAHVADVTTKKQRALVIAVIEFAISICIIIVNIVLGAIIKAIGFRAPMISLAILSVLGMFLMILVKETSPGTGDTLSTCQVIRTPFSRMNMLLSLNQRRSIALILLTVTMTLYTLILNGSTGVSTLYLMGSPFCWDSVALGFFSALKVFFYMIFSFLVIVFLRHRINNDNLILVGLVSFTAANFVTAISSGFSKPGCDIVMVITIIIGAFAALPTVFIRSQGSMLVTPDEQGAVFGLMSLGETFAMSFGPTITNTLYGVSVSFLPGLVFYFATILVFIGFVLIIIYKSFNAGMRVSRYFMNAYENEEESNLEYSMEL